VSDTEIPANVTGSILLALIGISCVAIGVAMLYGAGWAFVAVGSLCVMYSLILGRRRKAETLMFPAP
jgi:hypothetical protein